jgi:TolB-like protein/DNA-binding winged helix-turn-helix (wHTH) protein/cytochrome c-type biogenesis protein CcmH/NrfG
MANIENATERYRVGDLVVDAGRRCVSRNGTIIRLPKLSFALLLALIRAAPNLQSNESLLATVWKSKVVGPETVTQRVKLLRDALGDDSHHPKYVELVWGEGYRLCVDVEPLGADVLPGNSITGGFGLRRISRTVFATGLLAVILLISILNLNHLPVGEIAKDGFAPPPASIAVLPFLNMSDNADDRFLSIGIPETLLNKLAQLDDVIAIARTSSFSFQDSTTGAMSIGRILNVRYLLEGSVQRDGNEIRIIAQLIKTGDASHAWSFERRFPIDDLFSVQDEFVVEIAHALEVTLQYKQRQKLLANGTDNIPAYLAYLRGRYALISASSVLQSEAIARFKEAIALDPNFARAWLGLARVYQTLGRLGTLSEEDSNAQMTAHIDRALALDNQLGEAYAMRALAIPIDPTMAADTSLLAQRRTLLEKALELSPNHPYVLFAYALALCPTMVKDDACHQEKLAVLEEAIRRDPENSNAYLEMGWTHEALNQPKMPARYFMESVRRNPDFIRGYGVVAWWHWDSDDIDWARSVACLCEALERDPENAFIRSMLSRIYIDLGRLETAETFHSSVTGPNESLHSATAFSELKIHLYRGEIAAAAKIVREQQKEFASGELSILAYGAILEDALASGELGAAIDSLEAAFADYNAPVEYADAYIHSRSAAIAAVPLSELHRADGNIARADELVAGAMVYFEREDVANSVWRAANAWAYAAVLLRSGRIEDALQELEIVPASYLRNSWYVSRSPLYKMLWETTGFNRLLTAIDNRVAYEKMSVEEVEKNPPKCVAENHGGLLAFAP